ncbi:antibiotic biosynthesis monooxygenase family protein [Streptomyces marincola]|uniref:antibiotic biosynthesis monooxygenase family protein n=1 Tax=Streptomyces marincola TaxID=2878388 RepID=UPI001CF46284|nr:antibiotic biosynthesis monooxygenase family protein [Streptomyces marincola]UCM87081.1 antibiotic biosynthesis monooxygenase [Streptomyces marincola]
MPQLSLNDGLLHVFNIFDTDSPENQETILDAMRDIVDNADYPGWVSSTVHAGLGRPGTANIVQWRDRAALEARYAGQKFKQRTVPEFQRLATEFWLIQTEVVFSQQHPDAQPPVRVSPDRDDFTVLMVLKSRPENQKELIDVLARPDSWTATRPGYRSHTLLRGLNGPYLVNYAQWDSREDYEAFHTFPEDQRPAPVRRGRERARELAVSRWANTFRAVHSRSAGAAG